MYLLLGMKQAGWVTNTGQYSTDIKDAAVLSEGAAYKMLRRHKEAGNILIPVRQEDMQAI